MTSKTNTEFSLKRASARSGWFSTPGVTTRLNGSDFIDLGKDRPSWRDAGNWLRQTERDLGLRPGSTTDARARIKASEREVRELRQTNEILRKASAYFARAALDRPLYQRAKMPSRPLVESIADFSTATGAREILEWNTKRHFQCLLV